MIRERPCSSEALSQEAAISGIHEHPATTDGATDAIAQVVARIAPIGINGSLSEQGQSNLAIWRVRGPSIECLQYDPKSPPARFRGEVARVEPARIVQPLDRAQGTHLRVKVPKAIDPERQRAHPLEEIAFGRH